METTAKSSSSNSEWDRARHCLSKDLNLTTIGKIIANYSKHPSLSIPMFYVLEIGTASEKSKKPNTL